MSDERNQRNYLQWELRRTSSSEKNLPTGAIRANVDKQAPNNSYDTVFFYIDLDFECVDCGSKETWTAEQQQWYYEEAKGPTYAHAKRCQPCRYRRKKEQDENRARSIKKEDPPRDDV